MEFSTTNRNKLLLSLLVFVPAIAISPIIVSSFHLTIVILGFVSMTLVGFRYPKLLVFIAIVSSFFRRLSLGNIWFIEVLPYEAVLLSLLVSTAGRIAKNTKKIKLTQLDIILSLYIIYMLINSLLIGPDLYISVRDFRHNFLMPFLLYFLIGYHIHTSIDLKKGIFFMLIASAFLSVYGITFSLKTLSSPSFSMVEWVRPLEIRSHISVITLSTLNAIFIVYLIKIKKVINIPWERSIFIILLTINIISLIFTASRSAVASSLFCLFFSGIIIKKSNKKVLTSILFLLFVGIFVFVACYTLDSKFFRHEMNTFGRFFTIEGIKISLDTRMFVYKSLFEKSIDNFWFGHGYVFEKNFIWVLGTSLMHPHNFIINSFFQAGIFGTIFLFLIFAKANVLVIDASRSHSGDHNVYEIAYFCFSAFLILFFVGITNGINVGGRSLLLFAILAICKKNWLLAKKKNSNDKLITYNLPQTEIKHIYTTPDRYLW